MNTRIAKAAFLAGARVRNPSLSRQRALLQESEWLSPDQLKELQIRKLRAFLEHAIARSPYYRELCARADFLPSDLTTSADLSRLPVTSKAMLISRNADVHARGMSGKQFLAETSGTSGAALEFHKSEQWDSIVRAHMYRSYEWYDVRPWERNGYLWGYNLAPSRARKVATLDSLQNRFRLFSYERSAIAQFAEKLKAAAFLTGYSSMIHEVARVMQADGMRCSTLKLVKGTSETILDVYQESSQRAFGRKITSEYGAAESGLIAFECPSGRMHINIEHIVLEVGDDGEAIVTNMASDSFPIIRYSLGDTIAISEEACPCGRAHPVLAEVAGRRGGSIQGETRKYPALTFYYVFKNIAIQDQKLLNYRAVQDVKGTCRITIEAEDSLEIRAMVSRETSKYFGNDLAVDLQFVKAIPVGGRKAQYFISNLGQ